MITLKKVIFWDKIVKDKDSKKFTLIKVNKILILSQLYVFP